MVASSRGTTDHHIICDDTWHRIEVNGYILSLSPTQYRICRALFSSSLPRGGFKEDLVILAYRSFEELQKETNLSHRLLVKHTSNLNARIAAIGLSICAFQTGYILTLSSHSVQKR